MCCYLYILMRKSQNRSDSMFFPTQLGSCHDMVTIDFE